MEAASGRRGCAALGGGTRPAALPSADKVGGGYAVSDVRGDPLIKSESDEQIEETRDDPSAQESRKSSMTRAAARRHP